MALDSISQFVLDESIEQEGSVQVVLREEGNGLGHLCFVGSLVEILGDELLKDSLADEEHSRELVLGELF